jgi:peptidoglycan hydrolase CwlO-like protein
MDGYKWAETNGYNESAAKIACKELAKEIEKEINRLIVEVGALKGVVDFKDKEIEKLEAKNTHLKAEINMLRASMQNACQTSFVKCEECGVYRERGLVCWNCSS